VGFGRVRVAGQDVEINVRVSDLDGLVAWLRAAGIDVRPHDRE
jgi:hypothetical protein